MERDERIKLYIRAIRDWGQTAQVDMAFEECGELIAVLAKDKRGRVSAKEIITELADVSIMVEQVAVMLGYQNFMEEKENKLERLRDRLDKFEQKKREENGNQRNEEEDGRDRQTDS